MSHFRIRRLALVVLAPLLFLGLLEAALRVAGFGRATTYFVPRPGAPERWIDNPDFARRFFPPGLLRVPPPASFRHAKAPDTFRILVLGESAAMGDPRPAFGVARHLEVLLRDRFPAGRFEVIPVAMTAINSHALLPMARECTALRADAWVVFAGNNEMLGPYGAGSVLGQRAPPRGFVRTILAAKATRTGQLIERTAGRWLGRRNDASGWTGLRVLAAESLPAEAPERSRAAESFEANLRDLARIGISAGTRVILGNVAVNLRDCSPFGSVHRAGLDGTELAAWDRRIEEGRQALGRGETALAADRFAEATAVDPGHAAAHFLLGTAELARTNHTRAAAEFTLARDFDTLPLRTDSRLNEHIRQVAKDLGIPFVDTVASLAGASAAGIPGAEFFYEHVHLTPDGNHALALAFAPVIAEALPRTARAGERGGWLSAPAVGARLGLTDWNRSVALELMMRRCLGAPFTQRIEHVAHLERLAVDAAALRRARTAAAAGPARALLAAAISAAPEDLHLRRNHAEFLESTGALGEAAEQWQAVIDGLPHHPVAYYERGQLLRRVGRHEDAGPLLEHAIQLQPEWIDPRLELAESRVAQGRPLEAIPWCREALRIQPGHARAHLRLADALAASHDGGGALSNLVLAATLDPHLWEARYLLGVEYALKDKLEAARAEFAEVIRLKPDHARAHFNLGIALARLQRWGAAALAVKEALRLDPRDEEARRALAQLEARRPRGPVLLP